MDKEQDKEDKKDKKDKKDKEDKEDKEDIEDKEGGSKDKETETKIELPERCPICNKKKPNILLHIKTKESCYEKIDKQVLEEWRIMARKEAKKKYQTKFNQRGAHNKARKRKAEEAKEMNRLKIMKESQKYIVERKTKDFLTLAEWFLLALSQGRTLRVYIVKSKTFHLLEDDYSTIKIGIYTEKCLLDDQEVHAWLKNINSQFLEAVISLQKVILIPETDWINAVKIVEEDPSKEYLKDNLFRLIGKLQAYQHENTKNILIPDKYATSSIQSTRWKHNPKNNFPIFTKEDEKQTVTIIEDILGEDLCILDNDLISLLKITKEMENLFVALIYTTYD